MWCRRGNIFTFCYFTGTFRVMHPWWNIHDIFIPRVYNNFPCYAHVMIFTFRNFITTFPVMHTWWYIYIYSATLWQLSLWCTCDDICILLLYNNFPCDAHLLKSTFRNFITTFLVMHKWGHIHSPTFQQLFLWCTRDDMYIWQLYNYFPFDAHVTIYTFCNFITTFPFMHTWCIFIPEL